MYIEREAVINKRRRMSEYDEAGWCVTCQAVSVEDIGNIPSADVVEVVHGEWKETTQPLGFEEVKCATCSACNDDWIMDEDVCIDDYKTHWKYCPNCGADMRGDKNG